MSRTLLSPRLPVPRPTIYSVAKAVGVSVSTVSHILNHPGKYRYSHATRQRVWDACTKLQYRPNVLARSLARQTNPAVGLVCDSLTDVNITRAVDRVVELATVEGRHVVLTTHPEKLPWATLLDEGRVDWIIVLNQNLVEVSKQLTMPHALERIVAIGPLPNYATRAFGHQIVWDTTRNAQLAIDHLVELGHTEIAILAGIYRNPVGSAPRLQAAYEQAAARGIKAHWIVDLTERIDDISGSGRIMTERVLETLPKVTALYCRQDYQAMGAYHALHRAGLRIPTDMAVIGNFDLQNILQFYPSLTSINAPLVAGAEAAMEFLKVAERSEPGATTDLTNQIRLVVRESTVGTKAGNE